MADEIIKKRIKDADKTLTLAQFLASYVLGDSAANGTGNMLVQTFVDYLNSINIESEIIADAATSAMVTVPPDVSAEVSADLPSTLETLVFVLNPTTDSGKRHQYWIDFSTGATMNTTSFAVAGPGSAIVVVENDLSSRVVKFTASQLNAIYALTADATLVTATSSISYAASTHILTVGSETVTLDGEASEDAYFLLGSGFGAVTAVGSIVPYLLSAVAWVSAPSLAASTHYQISVVNGMGIIAGAADA